MVRAFIRTIFFFYYFWSPVASKWSHVLRLRPAYECFRLLEVRERSVSFVHPLSGRPASSIIPRGDFNERFSTFGRRA